MIGNIDAAALPSNVKNIFDFGICVKECPHEAVFGVECRTTNEVTACRSGSNYATYEFLSYCLPLFDSLPADVQSNWDAVLASVSESSFGELFADILISKWVILISIGVCVLVTIIYV